MDIKDNLRNIISKHLINVASSFFIEKSLLIIDQSADNKESFLAAADRLSKRIALFIDPDLAIKVSDILRLEIENRELKPGKKRKYPRVTLRSRVYVTYNGIPHEFYTENISEGGMYIRTREPFPAGSEVEITLPLEKGSHILLTGTVVLAKRLPNDMSGHPPGMAIEFKEIRDDNRKILRNLVMQTSPQDIPEDKKETMIRPPLANI
jgi:uncharacterized protein (TIGR02266 family)